MKVLILGGASSRNSGGVFPITTKLGKALQRIGDTEVHILLHDDEYSHQDRVHFEGLTLHIYRTYGPKNFAFSPDVLTKIQQIDPDVIHIMGVWLYLSRANAMYYTQSRTPYIISPQGMLDSWQFRQSLKKNITKKIALGLYERNNLESAGCIHALNRMEYDAIREFGLANPIAIIPNAADLPDLPVDRASCPTPNWASTERKTLLFLGRIHTKKGLNNLLEGWAKTDPAQHDWQLVIAGETADITYWSELQQLRGRLGIIETCTFIGGQFNDKKHDCFVHSDAFILPSFSEGAPIAVLEAWSYSLPVLMTEFCYIPEGFSEGAAIEIATTPTGICQGIHHLMLMSEKDRRTMGANGFRVVRDRFTWDKVAASFHRVYKWISGNEKASVTVDESKMIRVETNYATKPLSR